MAGLDQVTAQRWIDRWDAQQQRYMPDREERFTALIDAVEAGARRPAPPVLDLGCGPGSLAVRLLGRMPAATVVAIDADGEEDCKDWWQAATADPVLAGPAAGREQRRLSEDHHGSESVRAS